MCVCVCVCVCVHVRVRVRVCVRIYLCMYKCDKSKQCYNCHMYNTISRIDEVSKVHKLKI